MAVPPGTYYEPGRSTVWPVVGVLLVMSALDFLYKGVMRKPVPPKDPNAGACGLAGTGPWKGLTGCLSTDGGKRFEMHNPWESSMLVSSSKLGGCNKVVYDCKSTDANALLTYYEKYLGLQSYGIGVHGDEAARYHSVMGYNQCCLRKQCKIEGAVDDCGAPPNVENTMAAGVQVLELVQTLPASTLAIFHDHHGSAFAAAGLCAFAAVLAAVGVVRIWRWPLQSSSRGETIDEENVIQDAKFSIQSA
jgi:hypothetical protein